MSACLTALYYDKIRQTIMLFFPRLTNNPCGFTRRNNRRNGNISIAYNGRQFQRNTRSGNNSISTTFNGCFYHLVIITQCYHYINSDHTITACNFFGFMDFIFDFCQIIFQKVLPEIITAISCMSS